MKILDEDIKLCKQYAQKNWKYFRSDKRTPMDIRKHIFMGKLAEIYAAKYFKELGCKVSDPDLADSTKPDLGWDILVNDEKINVKCLIKEKLDKGMYTQVKVNYNYDKKGGCKEYCLMTISPETKMIDYYGSLRLDDIQYPENIPTKKLANGSHAQLLNIMYFKPKLVEEKTV
jgi:hypothetical protein